MVKKQKIEEGVDQAVVTDDDSNSEMDLEPRPGLRTPSSEEEEDPEVYAKHWRKQTSWTAEEALKYYKDTHQGVEYELVDPIRSKAVIAQCAIFFHSLFTAKKVIPSSASSDSSMECTPPTPPKMVAVDNDDGSSSYPVESSPPTPPKMVAVDNDDGSSSSVESSPPTPTTEALFFAETAMYSGEGMKLTVHSCVIIDPSGPVAPKIGCFYCSTCTKEPFYHPPEEQLVFGKHDCDKGLKYDEDTYTSDEEPSVPR